jgi:hypothetical protein
VHQILVNFVLRFALRQEESADTADDEKDDDDAARNKIDPPRAVW